MTFRKVQAEQLDLVSPNSEQYTTGGANDLDPADKLVIADSSDGGKGKVATVSQVLALIDLSSFGVLSYQGTWNASTNSPTLNNPPGAGTQGRYWVVSTAGTQFSLAFNIGDWIVSDGSAWQRLDMSADEEVRGPASSTANAIARFDGVTGKFVKDSSVTIDDSNNVAGATSLGYVASGTAPTPTTNGNTYFDSSLVSLMFYDTTRSKWLSVDNYTLSFSKDADMAAGVALQSSGGVDTSTSPVVMPHNVCLVEAFITTASTEDWTLGVSDISSGGSGNVYTLAIPSGVKYTKVDINQNFNAGDTLQIYIASLGTSGNVDRPNVTLVFKKRK